MTAFQKPLPESWKGLSWSLLIETFSSLFKFEDTMRRPVKNQLFYRIFSGFSKNDCIHHFLPNNQ
jgi:hypothetical protein